MAKKVYSLVPLTYLELIPMTLGTREKLKSKTVSVTRLGNF